MYRLCLAVFLPIISLTVKGETIGDVSLIFGVPANPVPAGGENDVTLSTAVHGVDFSGEGCVLSFCDGGGAYTPPLTLALSNFTVTCTLATACIGPAAAVYLTSPLVSDLNPIDFSLSLSVEGFVPSPSNPVTGFVWTGAGGGDGGSNIPFSITGPTFDLAALGYDGNPGYHASVSTLMTVQITFDSVPAGATITVTSLEATPTPEPATSGLVFAGLLALAISGLKRWRG